MIRFLIPNYIKEGKTSLVIGTDVQGENIVLLRLPENFFPGFPNRMNTAPPGAQGAEKDRLLKK